MIGLLSAFAATTPTATVPCSSHLGGGVFFGFPHWWQYMQCTVPDQTGNYNPTFSGLGGVLPIGIAVLQMLLFAAGFIAVLMVIAGGLEFIFAGGEPDKAAEARKRIQNSLIGLIIAISATAIVAFLGRAIS